jgi:hypothetical protein
MARPASHDHGERSSAEVLGRARWVSMPKITVRMWRAISSIRSTRRRPGRSSRLSMRRTAPAG